MVEFIFINSTCRRIPSFFSDYSLKGIIFMTSLLLRLFLPRGYSFDEPKIRTRCGRLSGMVGILCNLLLFAGKLAIGTLSGSVAITADGVNNLTDASGSVVTLIGFHFAGKPADKEHPYGHARAEYLSGLMVSLLILLMGVETLKSAVDKILHPAPVAFSPALVVVLVLSVLVKLWLFCFNRKLGKAMDSAALMATATDSRNDAISTAAILLSSVVQAVSHVALDGFVGLAVALLILWSGIGVAKNTMDLLLGTGPDEALKAGLEQEIMGHEKILGYHDLLFHDYGPGRRFASIHVEMDVKEDPMVCHDIIDHIERTCLEKLGVQLSIHYDPVVVGDPVVDEMRALIADHVRQVDAAASIHDFRMVAGPAHTNLIFDVSIPYRLHGQKDSLAQSIDQLVKSRNPRYYTIITFDESNL